VPSLTAGHSLADDLGANWPSYAAYAISFMTIGIIWINHHVMLGRLRATDHTILILNLVLLMSVALIPFATSLFATYLKQGKGDHLAAAIYGGSLLVMSIAFWGLNWTILTRKAHLLSEELSRKRRRWILSRGGTGLVPYALATALAPVSPYITLAISAAIAFFYALPAAAGVSAAPPGA
jgi:uncharacterized membrane protein